MNERTARALVAAATVLALGAALPAAAQEGGAEQRSQSAASGRTKMTLDERLRFALANGCAYSATIKGTVTPARGAKHGGGNGSGGANIEVNAIVACRGAGAWRTTDSVIRIAAMTLESLEDALERRASVASDVWGRRCVYMPDLEFVGGRLEARSVAHLCATPCRPEPAPL